LRCGLAVLLSFAVHAACVASEGHANIRLPAANRPASHTQTQVGLAR
jgi:hypothetical protein